MREARHQGTDIASQLIATSMIDEVSYFKGLAIHLGLPFYSGERDEDFEIINSDNTLTIARGFGGTLSCRDVKNGRIIHLCAPRGQDIPRLKQNLDQEINVCTRSTLASFVLNQHADAFVSHATTFLTRTFSKKSARHLRVVETAGLFFMTIGLFLSFAIWPSHIISILVAFLISILFTLAVGLRLSSAITFSKNKVLIEKRPNTTRYPLPVYTLLVALYDEANIAGDLVSALDLIDWPSSKLDVKLLLEAGDSSTIKAVQAATKNKPQYSVVIVPEGKPRTKPRALNYGLALARGTFVVCMC